MTGDLVFKGYKEIVSSHSSSFTPNLANATMFELTAAGTITMPSADSGRSFTVKVNTGTHVTWPSSGIYWNGGGAPSKSSAIDIYTFIAFGSNWYASQAGTGYA